MEKMHFVGDICAECQQRGLHHKLRHFYINMDDQLLKCESRYCLWPHNDLVSSSSEDDDNGDSTQQSTNEDQDDEFIKNLIEQLDTDNDSATACSDSVADSKQPSYASSSNIQTVSSSNIEEFLSQPNPWEWTKQPDRMAPAATEAGSSMTNDSCKEVLPTNSLESVSSYKADDLLNLDLAQPAAGKTTTPTIIPAIETPVPKSTQIPKTHTFLLTLKKASTYSRKPPRPRPPPLPQPEVLVEPQPEVLVEPYVVPTPSPTIAEFLNAIKRPENKQTGTRTCNSKKPTHRRLKTITETKQTK